jgi:hypothetical protein
MEFQNLDARRQPLKNGGYQMPSYLPCAYVMASSDLYGKGGSAGTSDMVVDDFVQVPRFEQCLRKAIEIDI